MPHELSSASDRQHMKTWERNTLTKIISFLKFHVPYKKNSCKYDVTANCEREDSLNIEDI